MTLLINEPGPLWQGVKSHLGFCIDPPKSHSSIQAVATLPINIECLIEHKSMVFFLIYHPRPDPQQASLHV